MSGADTRSNTPQRCTVEVFLATLESAKLVPAGDIQAIRLALAPEQLTGDAQSLARDLVARNLLTKWQAALIYQNKPKVEHLS